jgi:hypothetical protein
MTSEEHQVLAEIKHRGVIAKRAAKSFVAIGLIMGIPTGHGPLMLVPSALCVSLVLGGFAWMVMMSCVAHRARERCPRCSDLFFGARQVRVPLGIRALWGSECSNCGLGFDQLENAGE